jgi:hypothetical protein
MTMRTITITNPDKCYQVSVEPALWQTSEQDILIDVSALPYGWAGDDLSLEILQWDKAGRLFRDHAYARETLLKEAGGLSVSELMSYIRDRRTLPVKEVPFKRITPQEIRYKVGDKVRAIGSKQIRHIMTVDTNRDGFHIYTMMEVPHGMHTEYWHHELEALQ